MCSAAFVTHTLDLAGLTGGNDNILFGSTTSGSPVVIVLTAQPSGEADLTSSKAFKPQRNVVSTWASLGMQ